MEGLGKQPDRTCSVLRKGSKSFLITNKLNQLFGGYICSVGEPQDINPLHHSPDNFIARYWEQHHAYYKMIDNLLLKLIFKQKLQIKTKKSVSNNICHVLSSYQVNDLLNMLILKIGSLMNGLMKWLVCGHRPTNYKMIFKNQATRAHSVMLPLSDSL